MTSEFLCTPSAATWLRHTRQPPHASHLIAGRLDALSRLGEGLDLDRHVEGIGVQEVLPARHDADMALPEHEVAAAEFGTLSQIDGTPEFHRLHVGIARRGITRRFNGELHQTRAVEADAGAAAPKVGRTE